MTVDPCVGFIFYWHLSHEVVIVWSIDCLRSHEELNQDLTNRLPMLEAEAGSLLNSYQPKNFLLHDVVNDVVVKVLERFSSPKGLAFRGTSEGEWVIWLKKTMRNALLDQLRRRDEKMEKVIFGRIDKVLEVIDEPIDTEHTPRSRLHLKFMADAIREALESLGPTNAVVFEMHVLDDVPLPVIARLLGIKYDATLRRYGRACTAIREKLHLFESSRYE